MTRYYFTRGGVEKDISPWMFWIGAAVLISLPIIAGFGLYKINPYLLLIGILLSTSIKIDDVYRSILPSKYVGKVGFVFFVVGIIGAFVV